jgi:hypothetical protein
MTLQVYKFHFITENETSKFKPVRVESITNLWQLPEHGNYATWVHGVNIVLRYKHGDASHIETAVLEMFDKNDTVVYAAFMNDIPFGSTDFTIEIPD